MKQAYCLTYLLFFLAFAVVAQTTDSIPNQHLVSGSHFSFQKFPKRIVPVFTADARSHRLQLQKTLKGTEFIGSMGMQFPLFNLNAFHKILQFSVASSVYTTLKRYTKSGETVNADYFVDFFFDLKLTPTWMLRSSYGHTSQHLTDDAVKAGLTPINYAKDYVQLHSVHQLLKNRLLLYGGFYYFHNYKIGEMGIAKNLSGNSMLHLGTEITLWQLNASNAIYTAADVKLRQEFDFGSTYCFQLGYKLHQSNQEHFRVAYQYLGGYEERGQFYKNQVNLHTLGAFFDF